jgi:hypothetical protein
MINSVMLKGILIGSLCLLIWGIVIYLILRALDTPEVEYSWSTKQCVRVVYMDGRQLIAMSYQIDLIRYG